MVAAIAKAAHRCSRCHCRAPPQRLTACARLVYDLLAVTTGLKPAVLLDYAHWLPLPAAQELVAEVAAAADVHCECPAGGPDLLQPSNHKPICFVHGS